MKRLFMVIVDKNKIPNRGLFFIQLLVDSYSEDSSVYSLFIRQIFNCKLILTGYKGIIVLL